MLYWKSFVFPFLAVLLISELLPGQSIPFRLYTPHDGLPQSQVVSMFQDSRGYIWVGTHSGLAYFDGVKFHTISAKDGIPSSQIAQIQEDAQGNILFCAGKWLCKYDGKTVTYEETSIPFFDALFCLDTNKTMWAVNKQDKQLYFSNNYKKWTPAIEICSDLQGKLWKGVTFDSHLNRLVLSSESGLFVLQNQRLQQLYSLKIVPNHNGSSNYSSFGVERDTLFEISTTTCRPVYSQKGMAGGLKNSKGRLFFVTQYGKSLYWLDTSGQLDSVLLGVATNFLFLDKADNLWVAAEQGLVRVFDHGFQNFARDQLQDVWSMVEDADGNMWFGEFYNRKLKQYNGKKLKEQKINYSIHPQLAKGDLCDFYFGGGRDPAGNLYFPCKLGIKKYDGRRFSFLDHPTEGHELSLHFYLDTVTNQIISGTYNGVNIIDLKTGATRFYGKEQNLFGARNVLGVAKDGQGNYWLATGSGLAVLDLTKDAITKNYARDLHNFPYFRTLCVFGDARSHIWAGSAKALLWYDAQKDSFIEIAANIIHNNINALASYQDDYLVIGASDGVYFLDLKAFYEEKKTIVRQFNQHNGYMGIEPNQNCLYVDSKENVWVAASNLVTRIIPTELDMTSHPLGLYITEINNERLQYKDYNQLVQLPVGINTTKIRFEAVGFERPSDTEFSYKTDDGDWSEWFTEDFAILDNLSSGSYTFQVRTRPAGTVNDTEIGLASIQIKVSAPLLKEWWFPWAAAFAFFLVVSGAWAYARRLRQRASQQTTQHQAYIRQQEEREQERNRQNKYLQIQTLQAQLNPHFIFNVLQAVQTRIYEGSRDAASSLIVDLGHLIRRFLDSSVNMDLSRGRRSEITVKQEINLLKSYIEFEQLQYSNKFDYVIQVDDALDIENVYVPPMLIQPYVENAIKHGILYEKERRCRVEVRFVKTDDDRLICTITDNGVGRRRAKEIQDQFIRMYKSRGTQILEDRIKIMQELGQGISVTIDDHPEGGTVVTLRIDM